MHRPNSTSSAWSVSNVGLSMISSGGAVTGPVGATVDTGTKRKCARLGLEDSARPLVPNNVKLKVVAVATEQNSRPVAPLLNRSMMLVVSSDGPPTYRTVVLSTSRTGPANSIMWSIECTPTAVMAPPGASSGWARQLSAGINWPVEVVCAASIDITWPSWPPASRFLISTTDG